MMKQYGIGSMAIFALCVASVATAAPFPTTGLNLDPRSSCGSASASSAAQSVFLTPEKPAEVIVLYALPRAQAPTGSEVGVEVRIAGELLVRESFTFGPAALSSGAPSSKDLSSDAPANDTAVLMPRRNAQPDPKMVVFEFLDRELKLRQDVLELRSHPQASVEILVDGALVSQSTLDEFLHQSEAVKALGILPELVDSPAEEVAEIARYTIQPKFWVCGDDVCSTTGSHPETCLSCPEDCSSLCYCGDGLCNGWETCSNCQTDCGACCPTPLPNETRTELLSATTLSYDCYQDLFNFTQSSMYGYTMLNYKQYTVTRVRECDGSITETVISVTYFTNYCWQYLGWYCGYGYPYTPYCYFF